MAEPDSSVADVLRDVWDSFRDDREGFIGYLLDSDKSGLRIEVEHNPRAHHLCPLETAHPGVRARFERDCRCCEGRLDYPDEIADRLVPLVRQPVLQRGSE